MTCEEKTSPATADRWADIVLLAAAFFLLFWGLGERALWGSEGRWAEIAREILLTKDFFHPTIGGQAYFDKPLLTYWLIVAVSAAIGTLNEWVCRLPSALTGVAAVWATMNIGRRLWSAQVGRIAGWILLTTYGLIFWSRAAAADTENLAAIMLCTVWYWARRDKPGFITFLVFYLIGFSGALTKGLAAIVVAGLVVLPDLIQEKRWRALLKPSHFLALAIGLAVYVAPFVYSSLAKTEGYQTSGLALVFKENIQRFFAPFDHKEPWYVYFYHVPTLFLPWSVLLILALIGIIPRWKQLDDKTKWLLKAAALIFLVFTASGSRRNYYILPIIPFCALLTAIFLVHIRDAKIEGLRRLGLDIQQVILAVLIVIEFALPGIFYIAKKKIGIEPPPGMYVSGMIIGLFAIIIWCRWSSIKIEAAPRPTALIGVTAVLLGGFFCWQLNILEFYRSPERAFISQLKAQTGGISPERVGFFTSNNRSAAETLFYLDKPGLSTIIKDANELKNFLQGQPPRALICMRRSVPVGLEAQLEKFPTITEGVREWDSKGEQGKKRIAWIFEQPITVHIKPAGKKQKVSNEE